VKKLRHCHSPYVFVHIIIIIIIIVIVMTTDHFSGAVGQLCGSVCPSVCLSVRTTTLEQNLGSRYLT